jgi:hypothetical protein
MLIPCAATLGRSPLHSCCGALLRRFPSVGVGVRKVRRPTAGRRNASRRRFRDVGSSATDAMIAYLDAHPETDAHTCADSLVDLLLAATRRGHHEGSY